jgi:hypothetical protein
MPHFIAIETCPFGLALGISLELAPLEGNPFLDKITFGFEP